jgi:hypothetical protein
MYDSSAILGNIAFQFMPSPHPDEPPHVPLYSSSSRRQVCRRQRVNAVSILPPIFINASHLLTTYDVMQAMARSANLASTCTQRGLSYSTKLGQKHISCFKTNRWDKTPLTGHGERGHGYLAQRQNVSDLRHHNGPNHLILSSSRCAAASTAPSSGTV